MKQAKKMQAELEKMQAEAETKLYSATSGGGVVSVTVNGVKKAQKVVISQEILAENDPEMLSELIVIAFNEALDKADADSKSGLSSLTGGMKIPGL